MNIPTGKEVARALKVAKINEEKMIADLMGHKFNGYVSITIKERFGFEDGVIIFENGSIKGAYYRFLKYNSEVYGYNALKLCINAFASKVGVVDVYNLTPEQVELLLTFNQKAKLAPIENVGGLKELFKKEYDPNLSMPFVRAEQQVSKYELFKKIGLGNIGI